MPLPHAQALGRGVACQGRAVREAGLPRSQGALSPFWLNFVSCELGQRAQESQGGGHWEARLVHRPPWCREQIPSQPAWLEEPWASFSCLPRFSCLKNGFTQASCALMGRQRVDRQKHLQGS